MPTSVLYSNLARNITEAMLVQRAGGSTTVVLEVFQRVSEIDGKPLKDHGGDCCLNYTKHSGWGVRLLQKTLQTQGVIRVSRVSYSWCYLRCGINK